MKLITLTTLAMTTTFAGMAMAEDAKLCDGETFSMVIAEIENTSAENKEGAIAELQMAKEKSDVGDTEACAVHLENASKAAAVE